MTDGPRYSDRQMREIIKRASELQVEEGDTSESPGTTLAELEDIAVEAGIGRELIRKAAHELAHPHEAPQGGLVRLLLGAPLTLQGERVLQGEIPPEEFDHLLAEIQQARLGHGTAGLVGRTLTWRTGGRRNRGSTQISIASRDGCTEIRVEERRQEVAQALFAGIGVGAGMGLGMGVGMPLGLEVFGSGWAAAVLVAMGVATALGVARTIYAATTGRRARRLDALLDRLSALVEDAVEEPSGLGAAPQPGQLPAADL